MTYEIVDSRNNVVIDIANSAEEAEDVCEAWNLLDETRPYQWRSVLREANLSGANLEGDGLLQLRTGKR